MTGISIPTTAPDLLDRSITIQLARIKPEDRKRESELNAAFEEDVPDILGGILDVLVRVIARKDEKLDHYPRLADWFGLACIAAEVLDVKDAFLKAFKVTETEQHQEVVESNLESELLLEFMEGRDSWDGKKSDFYAELTKMAEEQKLRKNWPKTVSVFGKRLKKLYHNLAEMGIQCEDYVEKNQRCFLITKQYLSEHEATPATTPVSSLKVPGYAACAVSPVNASNINRLPETATETCTATAAADDNCSTVKLDRMNASGIDDPELVCDPETTCEPGDEDFDNEYFCDADRDLGLHDFEAEDEYDALDPEEKDRIEFEAGEDALAEFEYWQSHKWERSEPHILRRSGQAETPSLISLRSVELLKGENELAAVSVYQ